MHLFRSNRKIIRLPIKKKKNYCSKKNQDEKLIFIEKLSFNYVGNLSVVVVCGCIVHMVSDVLSSLSLLPSAILRCSCQEKEIDYFEKDFEKTDLKALVVSLISMVEQLRLHKAEFDCGKSQVSELGCATFNSSFTWFSTDTGYFD